MFTEKRNIPVIPPRKPLPKPQETIAICGECGLELKRVMHFSCSRENCPCFARVTM